jgi:hypothetical protein
MVPKGQSSAVNRRPVIILIVSFSVDKLGHIIIPGYSSIGAIPMGILCVLNVYMTMKINTIHSCSAANVNI